MRTTNYDCFPPSFYSSCHYRISLVIVPCSLLLTEVTTRTKDYVRPNNSEKKKIAHINFRLFKNISLHNGWYTNVGLISREKKLL